MAPVNKSDFLDVRIVWSFLYHILVQVQMHHESHDKHKDNADRCAPMYIHVQGQRDVCIYVNIYVCTHTQVYTYISYMYMYIYIT